MSKAQMTKTLRVAITAFCAAGVLAGSVLAGAAVAADRKPEDALKYRKGVLTGIAWHFGPVVAMAKGEVAFDQAQLSERAAAMAALSSMLGEGFIQGTAQGQIEGSRTLPVAFTDSADFQKKLEALQTATAALASASGSLAQGDLGKHVAAIGGSCKACHDTYRAK
jgi:cytochrome c556